MTIIKYNIDLLNIKFDVNYYKNKYNDLQKFDDNKLINHFIMHGYKEKRLFYNLEKKFDWLQYRIDYDLDINEINKIFSYFLYNYYINYKLDKNIIIDNNITFNTNIYKNFHNDLKNLSDDKLIHHFKINGKNEKRKFTNIIPEFNWAFYLIKYNIQNIRNLDDLWNYYVLNHIKNKPLIDLNKTVKFNNLNINQKIIYDNHLPLTGIIYVYYNRKNELKNETNLAFFIRQAVLNDSKNIYLFIINNYLTEVEIPRQSNVFILKNNNCYDIESYGLGIRHLLNHHKNIERFVLMNSGVIGPFHKNINWLYKFEHKLNIDNAIMCSTICYKFNNKNFNPGYFNYIVNKPEIVDLLLKVLKKYKTKEETIDNGEYGISQILHDNNYKITSLNNNNINSHRADRDNNLSKYSIYDLIFIKEVWRSIDGINRDSLPIKSKEIKNEIDKLCNFKYDKFFINYNLLTVKDSNNKWNSKIKFYNNYGYAEEHIIYPNIINKNGNKLALYCHSDKDNILKSYCIESLNTLNLLGYEVIVYTTCYIFKNVTNLPYKIIIINNAKNDCFMLKHFLNSNNINKYSHLLFINDTLLFPIHGFQNMKNTIDKYINIDFWGLWSSPERKEHIMSPFLHFSNKTFNYLKTNVNKYSFLDYKNAQEWEINLLTEMKSQNFTTNYVVNYRDFGNLKYTCPIMHPYVFPKWIKNTEVFAIKWKYIGNYLNKEDLNMPYLNYLLRYIHFNHNGVKGKPELDKTYLEPQMYFQ